MTSAGHRIFVSHSHLDNDFGARLAQDLLRILKDEHAVFYDALGGLHGGETWWEKIVEELTARDVFLLVLSPDAMSSPWVRREINIALNKNKLIVPVLHRQCEIRADLETIHIISFLAPRPYEEAFHEVLNALNFPQAKTKERWVKKGSALYDLKRYKEALSAYEQAIRLDPNNARSYFNKSLALYDLKRYKEAIFACNQTIRLDPNDADAYYVKAVALKRLGLTQDALEANLKASLLK